MRKAQPQIVPAWSTSVWVFLVYSHVHLHTNLFGNTLFWDTQYNAPDSVKQQV